MHFDYIVMYKVFITRLVSRFVRIVMHIIVIGLYFEVYLFYIPASEVICGIFRVSPQLDGCIVARVLLGFVGRKGFSCVRTRNEFI